MLENRWIWMGIAALGVLACGGNKATTGGGIETGVGGTTGDPAGTAGSAGDPTGGSAGTRGTIFMPAVSPWPALSAGAVTVAGGSASSAGGQGKDGGHVHLVAKGAITVDTGMVAMAPDVPAPAAGAMALQPAGVTADVSAGGGIRIDDGTLGGSDAIRTITATSGDIWVMGTVHTADLGGGTRQGIKLVAQGGDVFIVGNLDASGVSSGVNGGTIEISARHVVVMGRIDASGGDAIGAGDRTGGAGANVTLRAYGGVTVAGSVVVRGGAAFATGTNATGGAAAGLQIESDAVVTITGKVDARGGIAKATAAGGTVVGGNAGAIAIGESSPPMEIVVHGPVVATGGDGDSAAGKGGDVSIAPVDGTITIAGAGAVDVSGGSSKAAPGTGGTIEASPQHDGSSGVHVTGDLVGKGGDVQEGGSGNGADGAMVKLQMNPTLGPVKIDDGAQINIDGGAARGAGVAGGGGTVLVFTKDGDLTVGGKISARGGKGFDGGTTGGLGGRVYFFSDDNHNALTSNLGNLLVDETAVIDTSGGDGGAMGGSARSDGKAGLVPTFPEHEDQIAIFLNNDGVHGNTLNWLSNRGTLIAHGGAPNGNGGDIVFHGASPTGNTIGGMNGNGTFNYSPPSGDIDIAGNGTGKPGDYRGE